MNTINQDINLRFNSHPVDESQQADIEDFRKTIKILANKILKNMPICREQALAMTKLEEVSFWINAGIARSGIEIELDNKL